MNSKCKIWRVQLWIWLSKTSQQCRWSCGCSPWEGTESKHRSGHIKQSSFSWGSRFRISLHAHKQNSQDLNELKLKDPLVMSSSPRKRFISNTIKKSLHRGQCHVKEAPVLYPWIATGQWFFFFFSPVMRSFSWINIQAERHSFAEMRFIPFSTHQ